MLCCKYTFECIGNPIYLTEIKEECKLKPTVSKSLITFSTSTSEGYTVSRKFLMAVAETDEPSNALTL